MTRPHYPRPFPIQRIKSDCFSACLSWLLDLDQDQVPDFTDPVNPKSGVFFENVNRWLGERGFRLMMLSWDNAPSWWLQGPVIASGTSPREGMHAVLWDDDGLLHDPHASRAGIVGDPKWAMLILASPKLT